MYQFSPFRQLIVEKFSENGRCIWIFNKWSVKLIIQSPQVYTMKQMIQNYVTSRKSVCNVICNAARID